MSFESLVREAQGSVSNVEYNNRYDGVRSLQQVGLSIPPSVRALEAVVNWPRLVVDTTAEVLTVDGFESSQVSGDDLEFIWRVWQGTQMRARSYLAHVDALVQGSAFAIVGMSENRRVRTTVRSRDNIAVEVTDGGEIAAAVVLFETRTDYGTRVKRAAYYTPGRVETFQEVNGLWARIESQSIPVPMVPVVALFNKSRVGDKFGRSEMDLVIPFGDASSRSMTLLQLATELLSMPQRWIAGGDLKKFKRPDGSIPTAQEIYLGSFLTAPDAGVKFGQFAGANLDQVLGVLEHYAKMVSAMTGIPVSMLGITSANPESAEAMRVAKERMTSRCELKQDLFGDGWEQWARIVLAFSGRSLPDEDDLTTVWRDIALPSNSSKAAHLLQAHAQGVVSAKTARDGLPLTPVQRAREDAGVLESVLVGASDPLERRE